MVETFSRLEGFGALYMERSLRPKNANEQVAYGDKDMEDLDMETSFDIIS